MKDKKIKRLKNLCGIIPYPKVGFFKEPPFSIQKRLDNIMEWYQPDICKSQYMHQTVEILNIFKQLKFTDEEAYNFWKEISIERVKRWNVYKRKPIPVRKDNPNTYGEKFIGGGTRRVPRKCRKTAWKRFNKIFPN